MVGLSSTGSKKGLMLYQTTSIWLHHSIFKVHIWIKSAILYVLPIQRSLSLDPVILDEKEVCAGSIHVLLTACEKVLFHSRNGSS